MGATKAYQGLFITRLLYGSSQRCSVMPYRKKQKIVPRAWNIYAVWLATFDLRLCFGEFRRSYTRAWHLPCGLEPGTPDPVASE
jgi:hypothetical protein